MPGYDSCVVYYFTSILQLYLLHSFVVFNFLVELWPSSGGTYYKWYYTGYGPREWVKKKQRVTKMVEVSDSEASHSFQPVKEPLTTNTASETTRDSDHDEAEDLSDNVPEVSATTSSELPTENTSSEDTLSREKRGK